MPQPHITASPPAPLWRRLAAALYDGFLMIGAFMFALLLEVIIRDTLLGLPVNRHLHGMMALALWFGYFGWSWTHTGQTLGLRAWRLHLRKDNGSRLTWREAFIRYSVSWLSWGAAALGILWCLVDRRNRAWHDLIAGTEMVVLPKGVNLPAAAATAPPASTPT